MARTALALVALLLGAAMAQQCGPTQCYTACVATKPAVDFLIIMDDSGSMGPVQADVVNGTKQQNRDEPLRSRGLTNSFHRSDDVGHAARGHR